MALGERNVETVSFMALGEQRVEAALAQILPGGSFTCLKEG